MMIPASPRSHLILRQARFALGSPKAFFHPMFRIEHASKFPQRRLERRVRQSVIVFHDFATLPFAEDHQRFFGTVATSALRLHANLRRFNGQGAFFARPNLDARPLLRRFHPAVRTLKRNFRRRSRTAVGRRNSVQIAHQRVGRNGQQIPLVQVAIRRESRCFGPFRRRRSPRRAATARDASESSPGQAHAACET